VRDQRLDEFGRVVELTIRALRPTMTSSAAVDPLTLVKALKKKAGRTRRHGGTSFATYEVQRRAQCSRIRGGFFGGARCDGALALAEPGSAVVRPRVLERPGSTISVRRAPSPSVIDKLLRKRTIVPR